MLLVLLGGSSDLAPDLPVLNLVLDEFYWSSEICQHGFGPFYHDYGFDVLDSGHELFFFSAVFDFFSAVVDFGSVIFPYLQPAVNLLLNIGVFAKQNENLWLLCLKVQVRYCHSPAGVFVVRRETKVWLCSPKAVLSLRLLLLFVFDPSTASGNMFLPLLILLIYFIDSPGLIITGKIQRNYKLSPKLCSKATKLKCQLNVRSPMS